MSILPAQGSPWIYAAVIFFCGIVLVLGGGELVTLKGSPYYLIAGLLLVAAGAYLWRGRRLGMWLYLLMLAYTIGWSLGEVGLDGWALSSRIGSPLVLALYFLLPHTRRGLS